MKYTIICPGETLSEVLNSRKMTPEEVAAKADMPLETIEAIMDGKSRIDERIAEGLEKALGIEAAFWASLQVQYDKECIEYYSSLEGRLARHAGHNVVITKYGLSWDDPECICLECEDCNEVILDSGIYDIIAKEEYQEGEI